MHKIVLYEDKKDCCACSACMNICPKSAINMVEDEYGFLYPEINEGLCVRCGACLKVCGFQNSELNSVPMNTYVAVSKNTDILKSASGGVFASLADAVLRDGGIVYGASMEYIDSKLVPMHISVEKKDELLKLQGSKYVQSSIGMIYSEIKKHLKSGRQVLFSGTPCQVDGLKFFLKEPYENLLLVDIICHGVPSSKFFQAYIEYIEEKKKCKVIDYKFRDKTIGWGLTGKITLENKDGKIKHKIFHCQESSYYTFFLKSYTYRECCYYCKYASPNRTGDITIGDYWGIEKEHPDLLHLNPRVIDKSKGVSCLIVNTLKGKKGLKKYGSGLQLWESSFEKVAKKNKQLNYPSNLDEKKRNLILNLFKDKGYFAVDKLFYKEAGIHIYKAKIKKIIKKFIKR
ncbi:Coenzyme F420 hydrogenase/dehydrogenase, beta subunit C-terminal domain [Acetivibrio clariflavus]|uniref:Coenzyme F420-reducing hydrogenase, beta subunit n=1 Tax=Acetivibrio clariflavus (strain DSM 19732 / NBRC 101661 / EBR45) TaxID=720554 RepID=G8LSM1_ACECE|nr:Coenzyme F420 hydrogenase/dehydrogenase, beta subunit C-terminal domain [Acetivibrio clariflavus]AEV69373.1 coenzyme F420-reducing hydrogenase, beta subunit [Acetivibrio clariflavus DSM 19732]